MLTRWHSTIVDAQGNIQPFAILTILNEETQAPAQIYASESESQPLPAGAVVADETGYAYFYARGGRYRIQSADLNIDWRHVPLGTAATADIVGTMVGGSIIERGSNGNGEYVRFADGTQICYSAGSVVSGLASFKWTLPASYVDTGYFADMQLHLGATGDPKAVGTSLIYNVITTSEVTFRVSANATLITKMVAIGRWKT